ncbi:hypothetical protein SMITH_508 [Smithella sp. ME-1]|nr:hypothetical protein SMITH_508 [Smithella sp. ME-1]
MVVKFVLLNLWMVFDTILHLGAISEEFNKIFDVYFNTVINDFKCM